LAKWQVILSLLKGEGRPSDVEARVRKVTLLILKVEDWPLWREVRLEALREAPYAFGSKLSDWQGMGDTEERWRDRLASVPLNIIAQLDGKPAGMVSALNMDENRTVELISMWVALFARGGGVGDALIQGVVAWAKEHHATRVVLAVRNDNQPAITLYGRHGFIDSGPVPDLSKNAPLERLLIKRITSD